MRLFDELAGSSADAAPEFAQRLLAGWICDVLDRIDQFEDFDPERHYRLTLSTGELTATEREAQAAGVDDIELDL